MSSPQDHWIVPDPKTCAPLGAVYSVEFAWELPEPSQQPTTGELERIVSPGGENPLFQTLSYSYPTMPGTLVPFAKPVPA